MPSFQEAKALSYPAHKIHELVMDIEKYPEFLPWCKQARIIERISPSQITADLLINFKNFFEKYRSEVKHGKHEYYFVETRAIEGPFKSLFSSWKIHELADNKCEVEFFIEFQFSSFILEKMIGGIFEKAALKMMQSFESRAQELFGD
jgi:coenzyme Q-binding protein COQ10